MSHSSRNALARRYLMEKLGQRSTYTLALVVGSFINLYGQVLVPMLRGEHDPLLRFAHEFSVHPVLVTVSILLGYCFPFLVGTVSAVGTRLAMSHIEHKADFPDRKPDPVFRAAPGGRLVDMGANTETLFSSLGLAHASDVLSLRVWQEIEKRSFPQGGVVRSDALGGDYAVSYAEGLSGSINVYMTQTSRLAKGA